MAINASNADETVDILFNTKLDKETVLTALNDLERQALKSFNNMEKSLKRINKLEAINAEKLSSSQDKALKRNREFIASEEKRLAVIKQQIEFLRRRDSAANGVLPSGGATQSSVPKGAATEAGNLANNLDRVNKKSKELQRNGFPHKLLTTAQYSIAGAILYKFATGAREAIDAIIEFDTTTRTMAAVLDLSLDKSVSLGNQLVELGKNYGGTLDSIYGVALALGRAGVATDELVKGTEIVIRMARLTGDTFEQSASAFISYSQVFGDTGVSVEALGDKLAYVANVSRLSTQDIGTFSNYALSAAKSAGITVDAVGAMAAAFSNAGVNASTIGTQIRTFSSLLTTNSKAVTDLFINLGIGQQELATRMQQGSKESNAALEEFAKRLAKISNVEFAQYTSGLNKLLKDSLNKLRQNQGSFSEFLNGSLNESQGALESTDIIIQGYAVTWEKLWNDLRDVAIDSMKEIEDADNAKTSNFLITAEAVFNQRLELIKRQAKALKDLLELTGAVLSFNKDEISRIRDKISSTEKVMELENRISTLILARKKALTDNNLEAKIEAEISIRRVQAEIESITKTKNLLTEKEKVIQADKERKALQTLIQKEESKGEKADKVRLSVLKENLKVLTEVQKKTNLQVQAEETFATSTIIAKDALVKQTESAISNGKATKEMVDYTKEILTTEIERLQVKATELALTSSLSEETRNATLGALDFSDTVLANQQRLAKIQGDLRNTIDSTSSVEKKNSVNTQIEALNGLGKILEPLVTLYTQLDTIDSKFSKRGDADAKKRQTEAKLLLDRKLAEINLLESQAFIEKNITDSVSQKYYHVNNTLAKQLEALKTAGAYDGKLKDIANKEAEILNANLELSSLRKKEVIAFDKNKTALEYQVESFQNITEKSKILTSYSEKRAEIESKYKVLLDDASTRGKEAVARQQELNTLKEAELGLIKLQTDEQLRQVEVTRNFDLKNVQKAETRRLEDLKAQTDYEKYRNTLLREAEDIQDSFIQKAESGAEITQADVEKYMQRNKLISEATEKTYVGYKIQKTLQDSLNSGLTDFFDIQSKGWLDFGKLGEQVLNDILKKLIYMQFVSKVSTSIANSSATGSFASLFMAKGGVTSGDTSYLAKGGSYTNTIVKKPTYVAKGTIAGEAGMESVMPLQRDSQGRLGVIATSSQSNQEKAITVSIKNESGEEMQVTKSSAKQDMGQVVIDIVIDSIRRNRSGMRDAIRSTSSR